MKCDRVAFMALAMVGYAVAAAGQMRVASAVLLGEPGQLAPVIDLRSIGDDGSIKRVSISGWTVTASRNVAVDRGRRWELAVMATPYDAHSSRRMFTDGARDRELEFNDAALVARLVRQVRAGEHLSGEAALLAGGEILGHDAPQILRDRWRNPYGGLQVAGRYRFVTAEDPFAGRIEGIDLTAGTEIYAGGHRWTRTSFQESAGMPVGVLHLRQSLALLHGTGLDTVSAFLAGGSWDALGPLAIYGTRYAEFRIKRGAVASAGVDLPVGGFELGARASVMRAPATRASGALVEVSRRFGGVHVTAGVGRSGRRTSWIASAGAALFHP